MCSTSLPPFMRDLLMCCNDEIAARSCSEIAWNGRLQINSRLHRSRSIPANTPHRPAAQLLHVFVVQLLDAVAAKIVLEAGDLLARDHLAERKFAAAEMAVRDGRSLGTIR